MHSLKVSVVQLCRGEGVGGTYVGQIRERGGINERGLDARSKLF